MPKGVYVRNQKTLTHLRTVNVGRTQSQQQRDANKARFAEAASYAVFCITCKRKCHIFNLERHAAWHEADHSCAYKDCVNERRYKNQYCRQHSATYGSARRYGLTVEKFEFIYWATDGRCAICYKHMALPGTGAAKGDVVHVDHDAVTKAVRGFLCHSCNLAIGYLKHSAEYAEAAVAYLCICGSDDHDLRRTVTLYTKS